MGVRVRPELVAALLLGSVTYAALTQGAFFGAQLTLLQVMLGLTLVAAFLYVPPRTDDLRLPSSVACAAVGASIVLSAWLAGEIVSGLVIVAFVATLGAAVLIAIRLDPPSREIVARGLMLVGAGVAGAGWVGVAWRFKPFVIRNGELWRASSTITYANATACLLVMIALFSLGRLVDGAGWPSRLAAWLCLVGAGATLSRGGALGLLAGSCVLIARRGFRRVIATAWPVAAAAVVAVAGLGPSFPRGARPRPLVAAAALVAGLAVLWVAPRLRSRVLVAASAGAVLLGALGIVALSSRIRSARGFDISVSDRIDRWGGFLDLWASSPLFGRGPGGFLLRYPHPRALDVGRYAHNEYLQVLAEQGLVGLAVVAGTVIYLGKWLLRAGAPAGALAALAALAVHSATDFVWNVPVVPLVGAVILGMCVPSMVASPDRRL